MEILTKEKLGTAPTAISQDFRSLSKENQVFLTKDSLLPLRIRDGKSSDVGVGGRIRILMFCYCSALQGEISACNDGLEASHQDFHFLLQDPRTPEGFQKGFRRGL